MRSFHRIIRKFAGSLTGRKKYAFFISLVLICIVALCLGIYAQFYYKYSDTDMLMIGINIGAKKTAEEIDILKSNFNGLFTNSIAINSENVNVDKIEHSKDIVFTSYNLVNEDETYYSVNAQIPSINIESEEASVINDEIKNEFYDKANSIMRKTTGNTIYNVSYASFINEDILSIVIKSSLKEENKSEKVTVKTYNYSMSEKRRVALDELILLKQTEKETVQTIINDSIKLADTNAKLIAADYGVLYERDLNSDIYNVDNSSTYFLTQDGYVYIVYAYGNDSYTNEMDIVIF